MCNNHYESINIKTFIVPIMFLSVEKFRQLDEHYVNMGEGYRSGGPVVEERILAYQRHLDERSRTELSLEVRGNQLLIL